MQTWNRFSRFLRRKYLATRLRHIQAEIAHLEQVRANLGPALDAALREHAAARIALVHLDLRRPRPTVAMSAGPRDGVVRPISDAERFADLNARLRASREVA
jgi:hypothetical protein